MERVHGIGLTPVDYANAPWQQKAGPTVFQSFPLDTAYFGRPQQGWMVNFRVVDPQVYPDGRDVRA